MSIGVKEVLAANMHIGNLKKQANPKTRDFWLDIKNGLVIIDPNKIVKQLDAAREKFQAVKAEGKEVLIICEKMLYAGEIEKIAKQVGFHYLNYKIPSGFLTNFDTLISRIRSMNELKTFVGSDDFYRLTKKEQLTIKRKLGKVEKVYEGVKNLRTKPDLVIIVDGQSMSKFVDELKKVGADNIVIASSDFDRWWKEDQLLIINVNSFDSLNTALRYILIK